MMPNFNNVTTRGSELLTMSVNTPLPSVVPHMHAHTNTSSASLLRPESDQGDELSSSWMLRQALTQSAIP